VGTPLATVKLQAGLVRWAVIVMVLAVAAGGVLFALSFRPNPAEKLLTLMEATARDPVAAGITGYTGVLFDSCRKQEFDVFYLAPDKWFVRGRDGNEYAGRNGGRTWSFHRDPVYAEVRDSGASPPDSYWEQWFPNGLGNVVAGLRGSTKVIQSRDQGSSQILAAFPEVRLGPRSVIAGRPARALLRLSNLTLGDDRTHWVDESSGLLLECEGVGLDGADSHIGYVSLDLTPPADLSVFEPVFPEGTVVTRVQAGALGELAARVGISVREPAGLPANWTLGLPTLSIREEPPDGDKAPVALWRLAWSYRPEGGTLSQLPELPGYGFLVKGAWLEVEVTNASPQDLGPGEPVELGPGVKGVFLSGGGPYSQRTLSWSVGGLRYRLCSDSGVPGSEGLSLEFLAEAARSMLAGD